MKNSLIWDKNGVSMGDLKGAYASGYENILFAHKGRRELNPVDGQRRHKDILPFNRVPSCRLVHNHQKPVELLEFLIRKSSDEGDLVFTNDLHQKTVEQVAEEVGVSPRTVYRWKQDPEFVAYQNSIAEQVMEDFLAETYLQLKSIVRSGRSDNAKLKDIELVLKNRGKLTEVQEVEAEVKDTRSTEAIEEEIAELKRMLGGE